MLSPGSPHYTYFLPPHLLRELKQPSLLFPMGRGLGVCLDLGCGPQDLLLIRLGQAVGSGCGPGRGLGRGLRPWAQAVGSGLTLWSKPTGLFFGG